jgi:hypothetical protein
MITRVLTITGILVLLFGPAFSQQLVYRPINPAFGGDTFNYQWLLSFAQAQNKLEEGGQRGFGANVRLPKHDRIFRHLASVPIVQSAPLLTLCQNRRRPAVRT